jgi:methylmalonyl-CoA/ethylmalonyl-CoA epimerase
MIQLNHIGIAVQDLPALKKLFSLLEAKVTHVEDVLDEGVKTHFIPISAPNAHLEFLEVTDPKGVVANFIKKRGPGIHHISFTVTRGKLNEICAKLGSAGYRLVYDQPKKGAQNMRINFIHPSSCSGILIELMEPV